LKVFFEGFPNEPFDFGVTLTTHEPFDFNRIEHDTEPLETRHLPRIVFGFFPFDTALIKYAVFGAALKPVVTG
jgi:hypothetical protein